MYQSQIISFEIKQLKNRGSICPEACLYLAKPALFTVAK